MTIAAIWLENAETLWCVSDTRISRPTEAGVEITTDAGSKIYSLLVRCCVPGPNGFFDEVIFQRSFGFVFAGTVSPAVMTVATASNLLQSLVTFGPVPTLKEIAEFLEKIGKRFADEMKLSSRIFGDFEACIFGKCPVSGILERWRFSTAGGSSDLFGDLRLPLLLGTSSAQSEFLQILADRLETTGGELRRLPQEIVSSMLEATKTVEVGGALSIGIVSGGEFKNYFYAKPAGLGGRQVWRSFNGIDLDEIGPVGLCSIGLSGMV